MKKKTVWFLSGFLVVFAGLLIFVGVFYLEMREVHQKRDTEQDREKEKTILLSFILD